MTELSQTVTQEIRAEMARQRLSQKALAERLGWGQPTLSRRLNGQIALTFDDADAIAGALGVSLVQLAWPRAEGASA
jgi:transcriptional regulator with XRE-family HTH domain